MSSSVSSTLPRVGRALIAAAIALAIAVPALPVVGAVLDPDVPMVARATATARRASSAVTVGPVAPPPNEHQALAAEVVQLANLQRVAAGLPPLVVHPAAAAAAMSHSGDMAATGRMSHIGSDGSDAGTRLTRAGFTWRTWGENVAAGQRTAPDVMSAWMNSAGHRANILGTTFTTIGVGVATTGDGTRYWTMVLAA